MAEDPTGEAGGTGELVYVLCDQFVFTNVTVDYSILSRLEGVQMEVRNGDWDVEAPVL